MQAWKARQTQKKYPVSPEEKMRYEAPQNLTTPAMFPASPILYPAPRPHHCDIKHNRYLKHNKALPCLIKSALLVHQQIRARRPKVKSHIVKRTCLKTFKTHPAISITIETMRLQQPWTTITVYIACLACLLLMLCANFRIFDPDFRHCHI